MGFYLAKVKTEAKKLADQLTNQFSIDYMEALRQLQYAIIDLEDEEIHRIIEKEEKQ